MQAGKPEQTVEMPQAQTAHDNFCACMAAAAIRLADICNQGTLWAE